MIDSGLKGILGRDFEVYLAGDILGPGHEGYVVVHKPTLMSIVTDGIMSLDEARIRLLLAEDGRIAA